MSRLVAPVVGDVVREMAVVGIFGAAAALLTAALVAMH